MHRVVTVKPVVLSTACAPLKIKVQARHAQHSVQGFWINKRELTQISKPVTKVSEGVYGKRDLDISCTLIGGVAASVDLIRVGMLHEIVHGGLCLLRL